jgi:hypothetical protein
MKHTARPEQHAINKIRLGFEHLAARCPFHVAVLERFRLTPHPGLGTMGVTVLGENVLLLFDPAFVRRLPADQLLGVLLHEVNHVVLGHVTADPKDFPDQWARTVAEEVTVNEFVHEPLPPGGITLGLFPGLPPLESTAQRYERLKKTKKRMAISGPSELMVMSGSGGLQTTDNQRL